MGIHTLEEYCLTLYQKSNVLSNANWQAHRQPYTERDKQIHDKISYPSKRGPLNGQGRPDVQLSDICDATFPSS